MFGKNTFIYTETGKWFCTKVTPTSDSKVSDDDSNLLGSFCCYPGNVAPYWDQSVIQFFHSFFSYSFIVIVKLKKNPPSSPISYFAKLVL